MRNFIICVLAALALSVTAAHAGPGTGHSHGPVKQINEKEALENASDVVAAIVKKGKLDVSWAAVKPTEARKEKLKYGQEWVVIFNNPTVADQEKKTLYVFFGLDGQYLGANFSGN